MVQDADLNQGQGLGQACGEYPIGTARFRAAGRVVVAEDHGGGVVLQCLDDHLAGIHRSAVDAAGEQNVEAQHAVTRVEAEQGKHLVVVGGES
ncbi:hypothetical protein D3C79_897760 [compost metagenome]